MMKKPQVVLPYNTSIPLLYIHPKDLTLHYCIHNSKEMVTTWMFFNWWMGNENVTHGGILFSCKGKWNHATYRRMDKTGKRYTEWGNSDQKEKHHMFFLNLIWVYILEVTTEAKNVGKKKKTKKNIRTGTMSFLDWDNKTRVLWMGDQKMRRGHYRGRGLVQSKRRRREN